MKKLVFLLVCLFTLQTVARAAFCRQQSSISQNGE